MTRGVILKKTMKKRIFLKGIGFYSICERLEKEIIKQRNNNNIINWEIR